MSTRIVPVRVGQVELQVETTPLAGSEPTSTLSQAGQRVTDAFDDANAAIEAVALSVVNTLDRLGERAVRPDRLDVEFGLKFSVQGKAIVAAVSGEATLRVLVSYDTARRAAGPPDPAPR